MHLRPSHKRRASGNIFTPGVRFVFYALLCVALLLFFVWPRRPHPPSTRMTATVPAVQRILFPADLPSNAPAAESPAPADSEPHPVETILDAQIALVRQGISPGSIDGVSGAQTRSALQAFQKKQGIDSSGLLDADTKAALLLSPPALTNYTITADDLSRLMPMPKTWLEKSQQPRLDFENIVELLGEKTFSSPNLIRSLNPSIDWNNVVAGATVVVPNAPYPPVSNPAAWITISLRDRVLETFDAQSNLLTHFPCSIGRLAEKRPAGQLHVITVALNPNYTFNPDVFPESAEARELGRKLIIPPGPNNPVGVAWIGLDKPGYGIHGTPAPEQVGRTESHGCFRLANWNAEYLSRLIWIGMPVSVE
jgi:lipoprotein-anchoring transpeptidase ErfK/SrfK